MKDHLSFSTIKQYAQCEAMALAIERGEWSNEQTDALLTSAYIDEYFTGNIEEFIEQHPEVLNSRTKELKAEFKKNVLPAIQKIETTPMFLSFLTGNKQVDLEGVIEGVKILGRADYIDDEKERIVDLKALKGFKRVWDVKKRRYTSFIEDSKYHWQLALYAELYYQMTGMEYTTMLACVTKEENPDLGIFETTSEDNEKSLNELKHLITNIQEVRTGLRQPHRCENCKYCKQTKQHIPVVWFGFAGMSEEEIQAIKGDEL